MDVETYFSEGVIKGNKKPKKKMEGMNMIIGMNLKAISINKEQEKVVENIKNVLDFLENVQIKNEESLVHISKPVDDLLSSLKYLPIEPSFDILPKEIKGKIFAYLCDAGAFVAASVCREWKDILEDRLNNLECVAIGHCNNEEMCEDDKCVMPEEILKASLTLKLDVPLSICRPVMKVDSDLLTKALTGVSNFTINTDCYCSDFNVEDEVYLSEDQIEDLFRALEQETEMESVCLQGLDLTHLDQDRLVSCLVGIKRLKLAQGTYPYFRGGNRPMLDAGKLVKKLLEIPAQIRLSTLDLEYLEFSEDLAKDLANALSRVKTVRLGQNFPLERGTLMQLIDNILSQQFMRMRTLSISTHIDWRDLLSLEELNAFITKLKRVQLWGKFTREQFEAANSLPGVQAIECTIKKNVFNIVKIVKGFG